MSKWMLHAGPKSSAKPRIRGMCMTTRLLFWVGQTSLPLACDLSHIEQIRQRPRWNHHITTPDLRRHLSSNLWRSPWPSQSLVAWESQSPCVFCGCCASIAASRAWKRWEAGIGPGIPKRIELLLSWLFLLHLPSCRFVGHRARLPGFTFGSGRLAALFTFRQWQVCYLHSALRK